MATANKQKKPDLQNGRNGNARRESGQDDGSDMPTNATSNAMRNNMKNLSEKLGSGPGAPPAPASKFGNSPQAGKGSPAASTEKLAPPPVNNV
jgi:hypothetical protein